MAENPKPVDPKERLEDIAEEIKPKLDQEIRDDANQEPISPSNIPEPATPPAPKKGGPDHA